MALTAADRRRIGAAALLAILTPVLVLAFAGQAGPAVRTAEPPLTRQITPFERQPTSRLFNGALFAPDRSVSGDPLPADAPQLVGIIGRIDRDAVALVRSAADESAARSLAIGESVDGWRLVSLTIDAAYFERAAQRVRVPLPPDDSDAAGDQ